MTRAWIALRDRFSSSVLGTTSPSVPSLDAGLAWPVRFFICAAAIGLALLAGWIAGPPWGALFFFPALMIAGLWGGVVFGPLAWLVCVALVGWLFGGGNLPVFAIASAIEIVMALILRALFRESRRWGVRYRRLLGAMSSAVTVSDKSGRIGRPHPELSKLIGMAWPDYAGTGWLKSVHPEDVPKLMPSGPFKDVALQRAEVRLKDPASGAWRWHLMRAVPLLDDGGEVEEWISILTDVHERKLMDEQQDLVIAEARHRLKNLMTVIDSLVKSSRPQDGGPAVDAYQKKLLGRLHALSAAGDLALAGNYTTMKMREIVAATLAPFLETESARLTFGGPDLELSQSTGGSFALGVHELATNAIKYGALSVPDGRVRLDWTLRPVDGGRQFDMVWRETGGPPPQPPEKKGFGTRVISFIASRERNGSSVMEYPPEGFICRIAFTMPTPTAPDTERPAAS